MSLTGWVTAKQLRLSLGPVTYMAIFDDARTGNTGTVDASDQVLQVLAESAAEVASYIPALYTREQAPAQLPGNTAWVLTGAQLLYAKCLSWQRHPELVKTYGAQPGGKVETLFREKMVRIQSSIQQVAPGDGDATSGASPVPDPPNVSANVIPEDDRIIVSDPDGTPNIGDF